jgi:hypothetical protein
MKKHRRVFSSDRLAKSRRAALRRASERGNAAQEQGLWTLIKRDVADVTRQYFAPVTAVVRAFSQSIQPTAADRTTDRPRMY